MQVRYTVLPAVILILFGFNLNVGVTVTETTIIGSISTKLLICLVEMEQMVYNYYVL